jgi:F-type H+-transporting ATPase subunit epsilon
VAPGSEGELGILPGHARLTAQLVKGEVRLVKGQETKRFLIQGGFVHAGPASVTILTPAIQPC